MRWHSYIHWDIIEHKEEWNAVICSKWMEVENNEFTETGRIQITLCYLLNVEVNNHNNNNNKKVTRM